MKKILIFTVLIALFTVFTVMNDDTKIVAQIKSKTMGGIEFVYIPGGSFIMGSPDGVGNPDERPRHKVTVSSFWMGKFEVTQKQYQDVRGTNPSHYKGDNNPVEQVSWHDAKIFCRSFREKYGVTVRLPYEAEWEYACRAGTTTKYYWGYSIDGKYCWYSANSGGTTHPVGSKLSNKWGLYDMSGNMREWCEDWLETNYYSMSPGKDPKGPISKNGGCRVLRGGSWSDDDYSVRSAFRECFSPGSWNLIGYNDFGFRLVIPGGN